MCGIFLFSDGKKLEKLLLLPRLSPNHLRRLTCSEWRCDGAVSVGRSLIRRSVRAWRWLMARLCRRRRCYCCCCCCCFCARLAAASIVQSTSTSLASPQLTRPTSWFMSAGRLCAEAGAYRCRWLVSLETDGVHWLVIDRLTAALTLRVDCVTSSVTCVWSCDSDTNSLDEPVQWVCRSAMTPPQLTSTAHTVAVVVVVVVAAATSSSSSSVQLAGAPCNSRSSPVRQ